MKIKPIMGAILGLALTATLAAPASAQRRFCIVNERNNNVVCGREATEREMRRGRGNDNFRNRDRDRDDRYNNLSRSQIESRIDRLYLDILGRRADRGGLRGYSDRVINDNWDFTRVRRELARSAEARQAIDRLYREILGRRADEQGLRFYQNALERGMSLNQVSQDLRRNGAARNRDMRRR